MRPQSRSHVARWTVLIIVVLAEAMFAVWNVGVRAMRMQTASAASDNAQPTDAKPGSQLKAVVEVTPVGDGKAEGTVLEKQSENVYRRTPATLQLDFTPATKIVMGPVSDVRKGAVLHATGTVAENRRFEASQIVILTGYVSVN